MRLSELDPKLSDTGILRFDCPVCSQSGNCHGVRVPVGNTLGPDRRGERQWVMMGEFPETITITPSIDIGCWHGHITNGEITA